MARRVPLDKPDTVIKTPQNFGGVILTGFSSPLDVARVNADAQPYLDKIISERSSRSIPSDTVRCTRLFGRSATARETWLQQPAFLQVVNHFLRSTTIPYNDANGITLATNAILSAAATLDIGPDVKAQDLHRDDFIWQHTHPYHSGRAEGKHELGSDVSVGLLVPGVKTRKENGATMFIPSSHLWDDSRLPKMEEAVPAEMDMDEAFLFLGSTVHGGGANTMPEPRPVHGFFYCRLYLKPEFTKEEVRGWSIAAQKQAGYVLDSPFLGHCNEGNPIDLFRANDGSNE
ncbi:MAG: hypothetical protein Q9167_005057 [Letrouitia subvulpina]